jgi:hypothetical protein
MQENFDFDEDMNLSFGATDARRESPQLLRVKVTGYRLLSTSIIMSFGIAKAVQSYQGRTIAPTTFELLAGVIGAVMYVVAISLSYTVSRVLMVLILGYFQVDVDGPL